MEKESSVQLEKVLSAPLKTLISENDLRMRVAELAEEVKKDLGDGPVVMIAILKGSYVFISDFSKHFGTNVIVDFMQVSSYGSGTESSGKVQLKKDLDINIKGKDVIIVEDIIDSGLTMKYLLGLLGAREPKSLKVVTLLAKPERHVYKIEADYIGFDIPDVFVVGYGLDYAEYFRNLPYIALPQVEL